MFRSRSETSKKKLTCTRTCNQASSKEVFLIRHFTLTGWSFFMPSDELYSPIEKMFSLSGLRFGMRYSAHFWLDSGWFGLSIGCQSKTEILMLTSSTPQPKLNLKSVFLPTNNAKILFKVIAAALHCLVFDYQSKLRLFKAMQESLDDPAMSLRTNLQWSTRRWFYQSSAFVASSLCFEPFLPFFNSVNDKTLNLWALADSGVDNNLRATSHDETHFDFFHGLFCSLIVSILVFTAELITARKRK